jgi:hypothetical protein
MNLLYTTPSNFLTLESQANLEVWRRLYHFVERMPIEHVASYLRLDPASSLALVDAIVCVADTDLADLANLLLTSPLQVALALAADVRNLPGNCAMRDGRKWRSIPFIIFCNEWELWTADGVKDTHAHVLHFDDPIRSLHQIQQIVDDFYDRVLEDYLNLGMLVRFQRGRAQIGPALQRRELNVESEYYYAPSDRRNNQNWLTVKRDNEGLRQDVEMFQVLLDKNATESEMHRFFEEHPTILMQARMGIPVSHRPNFTQPKDNKPDFIISPILGPRGNHITELLELKGPGEKTIYKGLHPGFTAKVTHAVDQVRDYGRYLIDPANLEAVLEGLGYLPQKRNLAVLIGRVPKNDAEREALMLRQSELNVEVVTYDEILQTQANQLRPAVYDLHRIDGWRV